MTFTLRMLCVLLVLGQFYTRSPLASQAVITCGQIITTNTRLEADLSCPEGTVNALEIGASNVTLDLGGHTLSGYAPGVGVFAIGYENIAIRNGALEGFNQGIFIIETSHVMIENMIIKNKVIDDPGHFISGVQILDSQDVTVRDSWFEFLVAPHKEAVDVYGSDVIVNRIEVHGGGAGVGFSFAGGVCDLVSHPNTGTVLNSKFFDIYVAGIWVGCTNSLHIEGNEFTSPPGLGIGIQVDSPELGAVTGVRIERNLFHNAMIGIEFRGTLDSTIINNQVHDHGIWGIAVRPSLGCLDPQPGWACFNSTNNVITDNVVIQNGADLYHDEDSTGNTWERNICEVKQGVEIPDCLTPPPALAINFVSGKPGSFFTLTGTHFEANSSVTIRINGSVLGPVAADDEGNLTFLLDTSLADEGAYIVSGGGDQQVEARFFLDSSEPIRLLEGGGTIFEVLGGLAFTQIIHLPFIRK